MVWCLAASILSGFFHERLLFAGMCAALALRAWVRGRAREWSWLLLAVACAAIGAASAASLYADRALVARVVTGGSGAPVSLRGQVVSFPRTGPSGTTFMLETVLDGRPVRLWTRAGCFDVGYGDVLDARGRLGVTVMPRDAGRVSRRAAGVLRVRFADLERLSEGKADPLRVRVLWPLHRAARTRLSRSLGSAGALPLGLMLGERSFIDRRTRDAFRRLGIMHLLAISGLHLGILTAIVMLACRLFPAGRTMTLVASLSLYVGVVGDVDSLTRSYLMAMLLVGAWGMIRPLRGLDALGRTALLILLVSPPAALSVALQLSFAATLAVLVALQRLPGSGPRDPSVRAPRRRWRRIRRAVATAVGIGVAVQVAVAPLLLAHFGRMSVVGPLATLLFLGPVAVIQILAIVATLVAGVPLIGAASSAALAWVAVATGKAAVAAAAFVPPPVTAHPPRAPLYYGGLLVLWAAHGRRRWWPAGLILVALSFVTR